MLKRKILLHFKSPKNLLLDYLIVMLVFASISRLTDFPTFLDALLKWIVCLSVILVFNYLLNWIFKYRNSFVNTLTSFLIIILILDPANGYAYFVLSAFIFILFKFFLRYQGKPILNLAAVSTELMFLFL